MCSLENTVGFCIVFYLYVDSNNRSEHLTQRGVSLVPTVFTRLFVMLLCVAILLLTKTCRH